MSKGQLGITAERACELCSEHKFAGYLPTIERLIIVAAEKGERNADLGMWTEASEYLQKRLKNNGFVVAASGEYNNAQAVAATRLKVSW